MVTVLVVSTAPGTHALILTEAPWYETSARSGWKLSSKTPMASSRSAQSKPPRG